MELESKEKESEYKAEIGDDGKIKLKKKKKIKSGGKSRAAGARFELKVREDLNEKGWVVDKWSNNVEFPSKSKDWDNILSSGKVVPAKRKFNPFSRVMTIGTGFPDFIAIQNLGNNKYSVIGVEVKMNGTLSREEKQKCLFLLNEKIFSSIWIAQKKKVKNRIRVEYVDFKEKYGKLFK